MKSLKNYAQSNNIKISITKSNKTYSKIGIHLLNPTKEELNDAIERAITNCFPCIYIHSK